MATDNFVDKKIDAIYDSYDDLLRTEYGNYFLNFILAKIDVELLDEHEMISFLTCSKWAIKEHENRKLFFNKVKNRLISIYNDTQYVHDVLKGLE